MFIRRLIGAIFRTFIFLVILSVVAVGGVLYWGLRDLPVDDILSRTNSPIIALEATDGTPLVRRGPSRGVPTPYRDFPDHLVQAVIAVEDRRFFSHYGVDPQGIARALRENVIEGRVVQGGSTITQQLVKNVYLDDAQTLKRKLQEAVLAVIIERRMSKEEILTRYLNNIYLGAGATGVPAAARRYFNKPVAELTLPESAMIAGLIRAPSRLNPISNLDAARARSLLVLDLMVDTGAITEEERETARTTLVELDPTEPDLGAGGWFTDWVIGEAREVAGGFGGAMTFRTTLNPRLQRIAQGVVDEALDEFGEEMGVEQAALVALRPDGAILAMIGGRDYQASQFNRATQAERQPGSTFKMVVYYAALKAGYSPNSIVSDRPVAIGDYEPGNYNDRFFGDVTLAEALGRSLNAATVNLAMEVGLENVVAAGRELGIDADMLATPSVALGTSAITLLDMTGAYASIRAGRAPVEPWGIENFEVDSTGRVFRIGPSRRPDRDLSPVLVDITGMLAMVVERGTGRRAQLEGQFVAGKTGTTQDHRDAWFIGFNAPLIVGVWVGNDDFSPTNNVSGGGLPAIIWNRFLTEVQTDETIDPAELAVSQEEQDAAPICNVQLCAETYRSFRISDCTFQPYTGPRRLCTR